MGKCVISHRGVVADLLKLSHKQSVEFTKRGAKINKSIELWLMRTCVSVNIFNRDHRKVVRCRNTHFKAVMSRKTSLHVQNIKAGGGYGGRAEKHTRFVVLC